MEVSGNKAHSADDPPCSKRGPKEFSANQSQSEKIHGRAWGTAACNLRFRVVAVVRAEGPFPEGLPPRWAGHAPWRSSCVLARSLLAAFAALHPYSALQPVTDFLSGFRGAFLDCCSHLFSRFDECAAMPLHSSFRKRSLMLDLPAAPSHRKPCLKRPQPSLRSTF
jgi:hypothetical protein